MENVPSTVHDVCAVFQQEFRVVVVDGCVSECGVDGDAGGGVIGADWEGVE